MKLGCCVNMLAGTDTGVGDENIPVFEEIGYDYIELPLAQTMALSEGAFSEIVKKAQDCGIPVESCNNFFPASIRLTGPDADLKKTLDYVRRATERAARLGVKIIVLGSSGAKNIPDGFPKNKAEDQLVELLCSMQAIVAPLGITIALEPLNSAESNFIVTASEGLAMMKRASCENVKLLVDYYHMRMEGDSLDVISEAGSDLRHVHIASKEGRRFPRENDGEDYGAFFDALKSVGYNARISVEGFSKDIVADAKAALIALRPFMG